MQHQLSRLALTAALAGALQLAAVTAAAGEPEIAIVIKNGHFQPDTIEAAAGQKFKLVIKNEDAGASEFESVDFHREKVVQPGHEIAIFVGPLEAGSYEFFDDFHPEMRGHLVVK